MFGCFAVCFWVLTIVALDVVPKLIGDGCYMSMGKWSNLASIKSQNIVDVDSRMERREYCPAETGSLSRLDSLPVLGGQSQQSFAGRFSTSGAYASFDRTPHLM